MATSLKKCGRGTIEGEGREEGEGEGKGRGVQCLAKQTKKSHQNLYADGHVIKNNGGGGGGREEEGEGKRRGRGGRGREERDEGQTNSKHFRWACH